MISPSATKEAIESGHKADTLLREVLEELVENFSCPKADGFEGPDTFPTCGECVYCVAVSLKVKEVTE